jgi:hypothetical protein
MHRPLPITPLGAVWIGLYNATICSDLRSAGASDVVEVLPPGHELSIGEVQEILVSLWEDGWLRLYQIDHSGELMFCFLSTPDPVHV